MKKACFVLLLFIRTLVLAQQTESPGSLPQLLPLTPEAASLIKAGLGNINKSTGAVQASIPLYTIAVGDVKLPITLSYHSQGNKVEELCSRTGYGWSLSNGGIITRSVMGMPDERAPRSPIPANLLANTQEVLDYFDKGKITNANAGLVDTQPDEFSYSFNGHNGKFIINDAGVPEIITHENLKVTVTPLGNDINTITIVTPDGVKYTFGADAFERTKSDGILKGNIFPKTSFMLRSIGLTNGDNIQFSYNHITTNSLTGMSETVKTPGSSQNGWGCPQGHYIESKTYTFQTTTYDACYLSSISTSTGINASFFYDPMPDNSGDVRLRSFDVTNYNGKRVCGYYFEYKDYNGFINSYPTGPSSFASGENSRFYLTKLYQEHRKNDGVPAEIIAWDFDYYGDAANAYQPSGSVRSQDHFGFANGKFNQSLIPQPGPPDDFQTSEPWGDRNPYWNYAVQGVLKKITFPTNGTEEFLYEPNTIMRMELVPVPTTLTVQVDGVGSDPYGAINSTKIDFFTVLKNQNVSVNISAYAGNLCAQPCDVCKTLYCTIVDATTGNTVGNYTLQGVTPINDVITAIANHVYRVQVNGTGPSCFHGTVKVNYDAGSPDPVPVNKITGGVRVKKIVTTDPITGNSQSRFFYYAALSNLSVTSGVGFTEGAYLTSTRTNECNGTCECGHNTYTSNGIYNLLKFDNSHVYYTSIIETDDISFINGGIEYTYYTPAFGETGIKIRGEYVPFAPDGVTTSYNGLLKQTKVFDKNKQPKSIEIDDYESVASGSIVRSIYIRKNYELISSVPPPNETAFWPFDVREVNYAPRWLRLVSKRRIEYDDLQYSMETLETYTYGTRDNVLPAAITTTNSKGEQIRIEKKYVTDYTTEPVLTSMQQNYNIIPVIEEAKIMVQGGAVLEKTKNIYKDWYNDTKVIRPWKLQQDVKGITPVSLEDRIVFSGYDIKGNVTGVSKTVGHPIAYCWDFRQSLVTAEVKNAQADQVAYTSFEADSKGGWSYSGSVGQPLWVPTGKKMYSLSAGAITKTGLNNGINYEVSYWSNSGAANVNGTTAVAGRHVKGWTYYHHIVPGSAGSVTVSGSLDIDELRLYPQGALMTTFTYEPLVGITSQCDADNRISYFEYDDLNRLLVIRDMDNNILKQYDYQYKVEVSFNAKWEPTGQAHCIPCAQNSNYSSGIQEHEERDNNINSPTYGQIRWISDGATSICVISPDWKPTGTVHCEKSGDQTNTGYVMNEEKDINPCSPTYNHTRLMLGAYNCTVCPRQANWVATGNTRCLKDANNQNTGYKEVEYKDQETCSLTAGTTKWETVYDPTGPCYVCNTGTCTGAGYKCVNGVCELARTGVISSVYTKETGVWKYKCTYAYIWSDCTIGAVVSHAYYNSPCALDPCFQ